MNTINFKSENVTVEIDMCLYAINEMEKLRKKHDLSYPVTIDLCLEEDFGDLYLHLQDLHIDAIFFPLRVGLHANSLHKLKKLSKEHNIGHSDIIGLSVAQHCAKIDKDAENALMGNVKKETQGNELGGFTI